MTYLLLKEGRIRVVERKGTSEAAVLNFDSQGSMPGPSSFGAWWSFLYKFFISLLAFYFSFVRPTESSMSRIWRSCYKDSERHLGNRNWYKQNIWKKYGRLCCCHIPSSNNVFFYLGIDSVKTRYIHIIDEEFKNLYKWE